MSPNQQVTYKELAVYISYTHLRNTSTSPYFKNLLLSHHLWCPIWSFRRRVPSLLFRISLGVMFLRLLEVTCRQEIEETISNGRQLIWEEDQFSWEYAFDSAEAICCSERVYSWPIIVHGLFVRLYQSFKLIVIGSYTEGSN